MFGFFKKQEMNTQAAAEFWAWFAEKESWVIDCLSRSDSAFIWEMDARLKPVFPYFRKELEFQLGFNKGKGEFFFFHFDNSTLMRDAKALGDMMPQELAARWTFILEK